MNCKIGVKKALALISMLILIANAMLVLADTVAPDYYQFRAWQGSYTSVTNLILDWTTQCNTDPTADADDGSGGYECNLTVGADTSPTYYSYEGNVYAQMRAYHEPDVGSGYAYTYTTCGAESNGSCNTYADVLTTSGTFLYNINYDSDINDCNANEGATACSGHTCYNASWTFESSLGSCCGDDAGEYFINSSYSGTKYEACCGTSTDCVNSAGTCTALNGFYGCYKCSAGNVWSAVTLSGNTFKIKNTAGTGLFAVDVSGDVQVAGTISEGCSTGPDGSDFQVKSGGSVKAWINDANGNLCIAGTKNANQASITPSGNNNFIVKNSTGTVVLLINGTSGSLYALGNIGSSCTIS